MPLHFLLDDAAAARPGDDLVLRGAEAHHAAVVRRVRAGEDVTIGDGGGVWLTARCTAVAPKEVVVRVVARDEVALPRPALILVQALAKGGRDELAIQAATELGVDAIVPWQASRSVSRWDDAKAAKGRARWTAIVREAAKQAHRPWLPAVAEAVTTGELAALCATRRTLVLEPAAATPLTALDLSDGRDLAVVVGPEGGIAGDELAALTASGAEQVRLGATVLRTSTAGPAALAVLSAGLGRW